MIGSIEYLKKASQRTGYVRERYADSTANSESSVLVFFGDERARFILSSCLLPSRKTDWIVCSREKEDFFFSANEYWSGGGLQHPIGFNPSSSVSQTCLFDRYFANNVHDAGEFKAVNVSDFPEVHFPAVNKFTKFLPQGKKVYVRTGRSTHLWFRGVEVRMALPEKFWETVCGKLKEAGFIPVCHRTPSDHDMSPLVTGCHHFYGLNGMETWGLMRACGMVADFSQNVCYTAVQARCPCVSLQDRQRYFGMGVNQLESVGELDNFFSFPNLVEHGQWGGLIDGMVNRLKGKTWSELGPVPGGVVRLEKIPDKKIKKSMTRLIKVKKAD